MIWWLLILPGIVVAYFFFLRPILHAAPALKEFYDNADGFWGKVWAICGRSITVAWSYFLAFVGFVMQAIEPIGAALGDPDIKEQVTSALSADPKLLGYVAMAISAITLAARLRSFTKAE